jgi:hypothetical protein
LLEQAKGCWNVASDREALAQMERDVAIKRHVREHLHRHAGADRRSGRCARRHSHRCQSANCATATSRSVAPRVVDQRVLVTIRIALSGARERERASIRLNALSKDGLTPFTVPRSLLLANVEIRTPSRRSEPAKAANTARRASSSTKSLSTPRQRILSYLAAGRASRSPT